MRRFFVIIGVFLAICFLLSGCGSSEKPFLIGSRERNFLKSEFDENYTHYERMIWRWKKERLKYILPETRPPEQLT